MDELSEAGGSFTHSAGKRRAAPSEPPEHADLQALLDIGTTGMLLVSRPDQDHPHPIIRWSNQAARLATGQADHDLCGARLRSLRAGDTGDLGFQQLLNAFDLGHAWSGNLQLRTASGRSVRMLARMTVMADGRRCLVTLEPAATGSDGPDVDLPSVARMLGDLVTGGLYRLTADIDGGLKLDWADPAVERLSGYRLPELLARGGLSGLVAKHDRARLRRRNLDLMAGVSSQIGYSIVAADGREIRVLDHARPLKSSAASATGAGMTVERVVGTLRILEPTGEEARAAGRPRADFQLIAELLGAVILAIDADLNLVWAVAGREDPFCDALSAIGSGPLDDVLGSDLLEEWRDWIERALATEHRTQTRFRWPASGHAWDLLVTPISPNAVLAVVRPEPGEGGAPPAASTAHGDGHATLRLVLDQVAEGVLVVDAQGVVRQVSHAAEQIFDLAEGGLLGRSVAGLFAPTDGLSGMSGGAAGHDSAFRECLALRASGEPVPVEVAHTAMPSGALPGNLLIVRDISQRKQTEETIRNLAYTDPLTGLPNRLLFLDRLSQAIERARRTKQELAVMVLDLDRFKLINESLGLDKGDRLLRAVATRIGDSLRKSDTVARPGSDEFLILALATDGAEGAGKVAQKTLDSLQAPFQINGDEPSLSASVGIALFPFDGEEPDQLLKNAGTALDRAKQSGSHSYHFYTTDMNEKAYQRLVLESRLRKATARGELSLHFQPLIAIAEERIVGVEALLRWHSPDQGMIPPSDFIPIAEETGLILPIGEWVLRQAVTQMGEWHLDGLETLRIAVNISARQFQARDFVAKVRRLLSETGFPGPLLELELTESSIMADVGETVHRLHELAELGVQVTVDDFGTGYSSLAYLKRFPIGALKIDRSFIADVTTDANDAAIARAVVALAETLKVRVVGEGVETPQQLEFLRRLGCDEAQGYLIGRPMPASDALAWLKNGGKPVA